MANIEIKLLTPVHVGSGRFLQYKTEYVFSKDKIGIVDEHKVLSLIGEENITAWVASIENGHSLVSFLKGFGITPTLQKISNRTIKLNCDNEVAKILTTLKEHIHNGSALPYLPGSSIKGAIRSAILNQFIRQQQIPVSNSEIENFGRLSAKNLEKSVFGRDPNHDVFRFLRVGDAYFAESSTVAIVMENLNLKEQRGEESAIKDISKRQLVEALGTESLTTFDLKFDQKGIELNRRNGEITKFPDSFSSVKKLFELINKNTLELLKEEIEFWEDYLDDDANFYTQELKKVLNQTEKCSDGTCILRMAHGSGWTFITGAWAKNNSLVDDSTYEKIVNSSRPGNLNKYSNYPFPKSRRITSNIDLMGFVQLSVL